MSFLPCDDGKLVEFVTKYGVLYEVSVTGYKDKVMRDNIWKEIGENLNKLGMYLNIYTITSL